MSLLEGVVSPLNNSARPKIVLSPGIKRSLSRRNDSLAIEAQRSFEQLRPKVLQRDKHTCQACGFVSKPTKDRPGGFMEVHHIDDDHHHNEMNNLITLCPFCHMVFTLGRRGEQFFAEPVWLPEISQERLNGFIHCIFALLAALETSDKSIMLDPSCVDEVKHVVELFEDVFALGSARIRLISEEVDGFDRLEVISGAMTGLSNSEYKNRDLLLSGLRLIPHRSMFDKEVDFWLRHAWGASLAPATWRAMLSQVQDALNIFKD